MPSASRATIWPSLRIDASMRADHGSPYCSLMKWSKRRLMLNAAPGATPMCSSRASANTSRESTWRGSSIHNIMPPCGRLSRQPGGK